MKKATIILSKILVFTSLKIHDNSKSYDFLVEKLKPYYKYCPVPIGMVFSTKLVLFEIC